MFWTSWWAWNTTFSCGKVHIGFFKGLLKITCHDDVLTITASIGGSRVLIHVSWQSKSASWLLKRLRVVEGALINNTFIKIFNVLNILYTTSFFLWCMKIALVFYLIVFNHCVVLDVIICRLSWHITQVFVFSFLFWSSSGLLLSV